MKKLYISFALFIATISAFAQTPTISMTTTLSINSQITIGLKGNTASTPIQIDWGNGVKENFTIGTDMEFFGYPVKGSTLKIWGPGITGLTIQSKNITALEFSGATLLESLFCKNNQITTLNLTGCTALEFVECNQNLISSLLLPSTTTLTYIDCSNNNLTLASLPLKQSSWTNYIYTPQKAYKLPKKEYSVSEEIDLSSQKIINSITTTYVWKTKGGTTLVNGTDYNVTNGKFSFIKGNADSLYCEMTNNSLPGLTLNTTCIAIPTPPAIVMTFENATSIWIGVGANVNAIIKADWGDGNLESIEFKNYIRSYFSRSVLGKTIKLYGDKLSYLQINSAGLTEINASNAPNLRELECTENKLTTIDVSNNIELRELDCSKNQLTSIDVSHNSNLYKLNCSNNYLAYNNIPTKKPSWTSYIFSPQIFKLQKSSYNINETIDISHHYSINGNISIYKWKTFSGVTLTKGVDYTESSGIFTFLVANADLLVCELTNATFPELILKTEAITIQSSEPSIIATINNQMINSPNLEIGTSAITTIQIDWGDGSLTNHIVNSTNSQIRGTLKGSTIKIYGAGITNLRIYYCLLTALDVSKAILLKELDCHGNNITTINSSNNIKLIRLDCAQNELTELDLSQNTSLSELDCASNKLSTIDISKNTALTQLDCSSNCLTSLDVSNNKALFDLHCGSNKLSTIDASKNTALFLLHCSSNYLTALDLSKNTALRYLYCNLNRFNFSTLPAKQPAWITYTYSPQIAIALPKKNYAINEEIDLNSHLIANGSTTAYTWKTKGGKTLVSGTDYSENNGKFNFIKTSIDSIYCEMKNSTFPDLTLKTTALALPLPQDPNILMTTTTSIGSTFSFIIRSATDNTTAYVNWGDGNLIPYNANTSNSIINGTLKSNTIKVFGEGIAYIDISSKKITTIDISNCISLKYFFCNVNQLVTLDVSKNTALTRLNSSDNQISEIDVTKNTALIYLDCYNNKLANLDVSKNTTLAELNCSYNKLTSIDVTNNIALTNLDCDNNQFASLDVTKNTSLTRLDCGRTTLSILDITKNLMLKELYCAANNITQLDVSKNTSLSIINCYENKLSTLALNNISTITEVRCYSNKLTFNSLPIKQSSWTVYTYSPQTAITLQKKNYTLSEVIDLSSQLTINGKTTNYIWKTKGGITLTSGIDYSSTNGATTFLKIQTDSVYCQMTNTTFPGLTLSTTNIKVTQFPTSIDETNLVINIYPNPIKETLNIEMNENISKVEVYNVVGLKVYEKQGNSTPNMAIPAENFPKGLLIVKVYGKNWVMKRNVIKE